VGDVVKEILIAAGLGVLAYLGWSGVDIWPVVILLVLLGAVVAVGWHQHWLPRPGRKVEGAAQGITFDDIGGQATAKNELKEALEFLLKADQTERLGIRPLKGILLTGPPGTGKTLLAKAAANYTGSAFLSASGSEFVEMYAGVGAQRVRQLFADARRLARREGRGSAIIFIDEIEVMAGKRGQHQSHLEYDQTLNQLLVEMDGMNVHDDVRVLVMAASNRADLLDQALLRPGRFDRVVRVDLPDWSGRLQILQLHTRNKPLASDVDLAAIARETFGFSGAHLESLCNEAAILAFREGRNEITMADLKSAVDKVMLGEKLDRQVHKEERERVAVHESGHAVIAEHLQPGSVASVTIIPRGMALGFVRPAPEPDRWLRTVSELRAEIAVLLAGSTAERILLGQPSTGAANDFEKAFDIARQMVLAGLSPLGVVQEEALSPETLYQAVRDIVAAERERVDRLVERYRAAIQALSQRLLVEETVSGEEVRSLLHQVA
jgi:cell division protease FtsH